jgi:hypothetical protein
MDDLQPQMQGQMGGFEDAPNAHGEGLLALIAFAQAGASGRAVQASDLGLIAVATERADGAFGPKCGLDIRESSVFILEVFGGQNGLGHGEISLAQI